MISPLMQALYTGQTDEVQRLASELGSATLTIHEAAGLGEVGHLERLLIGNLTAVNSWSPDGFQPLALAAFFGRRWAVELLLERGADRAAVTMPAARQRTSPVKQAY